MPAGHPYVVCAVGPPGAPVDGLEILPDVIPPGRPPGQWWPPVALHPPTLQARILADGVDVLHVHFGFESVPLEDLLGCVEVLRHHRVALVVTVHDLRNPHVEDDDEYAPRLDLLVQSADLVITLTTAAADQIRHRWGGEVVVLPHPHVAPLERIGASPRTRRPQRPAATGPGATSAAGPVIGLPLKSLRSNTLRAPQVREVVDVVHRAGGRLRIGVHTEALDPGFVRYDRAMADLLSELAPGGPGGSVSVDVHDRHDDEAFLTELARHDAVLLPYRFGTHSGVLEACRDVGTLVIAPDVGCYTSQADCPTYDPADIPTTLPRALAELAPGPRWARWGTDSEGRERQARDVRAAHRRLYRLAAQRARARDLDGAVR